MLLNKASSEVFTSGYFQVTFFFDLYINVIIKQCAFLHAWLSPQCLYGNLIVDFIHLCIYLFIYNLNLLNFT